MKLAQLYYEDARDAGYPHELETPRKLGPKDIQFVKQNEGRSVGSEVLKFDGSVLAGSTILQNDSKIFQYSHNDSEEGEFHIESVEMFRNLWNSIHIPAQSAKLI